MTQRNDSAELQSLVEFTVGPVIFKERFEENSPCLTSSGYKEFRLYANDYPTVYILYSDEKSPQAYVGETSHLRRRMKDHLKNQNRRRLKRLLAIGCEAFNKSATYNIESNLISCMLADGKYVLQNRSQTSSEFTMHNYFGKQFYSEKLFRLIWNQLIEEGIARNALDRVKNSDVFKLSPFKQLSVSQNELVCAALDFCENAPMDGTSVLLIKGDAGTGKSVVLSTLFKALMDRSEDPGSALCRSENYFLVNHTEQWKTYCKIAKRVEGLRVGQFMKPTTFVNESKRGAIAADVVVVDEAHLLLSRSDAYNNFKETNHLEEIVKRCRVAVVVYDDRQVLKLKSYWDEARLKKIVETADRHTEFELTEQFRMQASREIVEWIDAFVNERKVLPMPAIGHADEESPFEFRIFEDASRMYEAIRRKDAACSLSRMVATFDYEHKKDGRPYYVHEGSFRLPWNVPTDKDTWAERSETLQEVGSIYTVQGFDLNYAGVILGPSITYDEDTDRVKVLPDRYKDIESFKGREGIPSDELDGIKERIILNSVNVLMKRAIRGLYIYASDEALRNRLMAIQGQASDS